MPTATVTTPMGTWHSWVDIQGNYLTPIVTSSTDFTLTPVSFTHDGDMIVENGNYAYVQSGKDIKGTYTYHWMKGSDGVWRLHAVTIK